MSQARLDADRQVLGDAKSRGPLATLQAYARLSGPGWLQSAITLGGGSLSGALFLGVLGGFTLLWLQVVAILLGVIMLSAISYVVLSTGQSPFRSINQHINPVLGWGWIIATCLANLIWCMPQFSLAYAAIQKNLSGGAIPDHFSTKLIVSGVLLAAASAVVLLNGRRGVAAKLFDWILKLMVGTIVVCFFAVAAYLLFSGRVSFVSVVNGLWPDLNSWNQPAGQLAGLLDGLPASVSSFWKDELVTQQRNVMIGAAATAVGINMTFLLPYSMLNRGWDKDFRGLARFDLLTGMAIPYLLVTSCVVIASAAMFHARADEAFLSNDPQVLRASPLFANASGILGQRLAIDDDRFAASALGSLSDEQRASLIATGAAGQLSVAERQLAAATVKRNAFQLAQSLSPLLGEKVANLIFGVGVFGMGFSTIIILMLINGFAFCEMFNRPQGSACHVFGCLVAGVSGALWPLVWSGSSQFWLTILASVFGMMLLPIAYVTFFMMMNSRSLLGKELPSGVNRLVWNALLGLAVAGAIVAAMSAILTRAADPTAGPLVIGLAAIYAVAVLAGFFLRSPRNSGETHGEST